MRPIATPLSARERDVLGELAEGYSNDWIAERLGVKPRTVETHIARIFTKLGIDDDPTKHRRVLAVLAHLKATA